MYIAHILFWSYFPNVSREDNPMLWITTSMKVYSLLQLTMQESVVACHNI